MSEFAESIHIWLPGTLVMVGLILCSAFFSASETAFFFLSREEIRDFSRGQAQEKMVSTLMGDPDRLLTAVLFWNLLINLAYFSVGIFVVAQLTNESFHVVAGLVGVMNLVTMIVLGEVVPKSTAAVFRHQVAPLASLPLAVAVFLLDPVIPILGKTARVLRRAFWPHVEHEAHLQPEDLEKAIDSSAAFTTELLEVEQKVLHNILDMNEVAVEEVMRPRNLCVVADAHDTIATFSGAGIESTDYVLLRDDDQDGFTRAVPLSRVVHGDAVPFDELAEPVIYVPWCASLAFVLSEFRNRYRNVAVVVHEHGEVVGAVTYEDLLEFMLSDAPSRTRWVLGREPLIEIGENRYHAEGLITLRYLSGQLRIAFDADDDNLTTLAGLFHDELERIPQLGDRISWEGWSFAAIEVTKRGLIRALVEPERYARSSRGESE